MENNDKQGVNTISVTVNILDNRKHTKRFMKCTINEAKLGLFVILLFVLAMIGAFYRILSWGGLI